MKTARMLPAALAGLAICGAGLLARDALRHEVSARPGVYEVRPEASQAPANSPSTTSPSTTSPTTTSPTTTSPDSTAPLPSSTVPVPDDTTATTAPRHPDLESWLNDLVAQLRQRVR